MKRVPSKIGSSPTKIGEYLACGLPVVVNEGLGDSDQQIREANAGHVVPTYDEPALMAAGAAVLDLLHDVTARDRARSLAERVFDVRAGASQYDAMYRRMLARVKMTS